MSKQLFHRVVMTGDRMTHERFQQCAQVVGIPADLLPKPREPKRPGPKPKAEAAGQAA